MLLLSTLLLVASPTCNATSGPPRVAFIGNSILYYNDVPRLLETISAPGLTPRLLLRAGRPLTPLLAGGNGMRRIFGTENGKLEDGTFDTGAPTVDELLVGDASPSWDYVVLHDFTQGPARPETRHESARSLKDTYGPLLARTDAMPVFLATHAYRVHNRGSEDLGAIPHEFTEKLSEGYKAYADALTAALPERREVRIAPSGMRWRLCTTRSQSCGSRSSTPTTFTSRRAGRSSRRPSSTRPSLASRRRMRSIATTSRRYLQTRASCSRQTSRRCPSRRERRPRIWWRSPSAR